MIHRPSTVEQIKSTTEIREKIISAARAARKSASYPAELNNDIVYSKDQGLMMEDYRLLSGLVKHNSLAHVVASETAAIGDEEKHLWMDSQSHSSSASSDSHETDCGLGYPTGFITQFKVSIVHRFRAHAGHRVFIFRNVYPLA